MTQFSTPSVLLYALRWIPEVNRLDLFAIMRCFETDLYLFGCVRWCIGPWPYGTGAHTDQHGAKCDESAWCIHADGLLPVSQLLGHTHSRGQRDLQTPQNSSNGASRQIISGWRRRSNDGHGWRSYVIISLRLRWKSRLYWKTNKAFTTRVTVQAGRLHFKPVLFMQLSGPT